MGVDRTYMVCLVRGAFDIEQRRLDTRKRPVGFGLRPILPSYLLHRSRNNPLGGLLDNAELAGNRTVAIPGACVSNTSARVGTGRRHVLSYIPIFQYLGFLGTDRFGDWPKKRRLFEKTYNLGHLRYDQTSTICRGPHDAVGEKSHGHGLGHQYYSVILSDNRSEN
jgi:hypothetical protein